VKSIIKLLIAGLCVAFALLGYRLYGQLSDFPVEREIYPVDAIAYMAEHDLNGRLVVSFNWAQYAIAALHPHTKVAFDGRFRTCYPQEVIDMHFDFLLGDAPGKRYRDPESGEVDGNRVLDFKDPNLVLLDRRFPQSEQILENRKDFVLLYQDGLAQVWGRKSIYDDPASPQYLAESERSLSDEVPTGSVTWPALPDYHGGALYVGHPSSKRDARACVAPAKEAL